MGEDTVRAGASPARVAGDSGHSLDDDALLAGLAHDLRNPLGPVRNAVYLLRHRVKGDAESLAWLDLVDRQVDAMAGMIDEMDDLARLMRGTLVAARVSTDIGALLATAVADSQAAATARRQALACEAPAGHLRISADPLRLRQAFVALLRAVSCTSPPGARLRLRAESAGATAVVTLDSTPTEPRPRAGTTKEPPPPRSLPPPDRIPLALARGLFQLHDGTLAVERLPDGGCHYVVRMPLLPADASPAQ